tara:strand:+ start:2079 stop:2786 length:708 start_codon:yes stop_codon:yes gene_type:complete
MVSVIEVYTILKNLANKEQKGFITPDVFNSFAGVAQRNIINEMFDELEQGKSKASVGRDTARRRSSYQSVKEDLGRYIVKAGLTETTNTGYPYLSDEGYSDVWSIPSDCRKILSIRNNSFKQIDLVYDVEKIDHITSSSLSAPDAFFPVALITDVIEILPSAGTSTLAIVYYRNPAVNPQLATGPNNTFDLANSVDFDLPEDYTSEVVYEIAKLLGVRLRDQNIQVFGTQEAQQQ